MSNRRIIGLILLAIVVLALLAGGGYALYRYGYVRGVATASEGEVFLGRFHGDFLLPEGDSNDHVNGFFDRLGPRTFGFDSHDRVLRHDYDFQLLPSTRFFATRIAFSPLSLLFRIVVCVFILWVGYKVVSTIFSRNGWQLTFRSMSDNKESTDDKGAKKK